VIGLFFDTMDRGDIVEKGGRQYSSSSFLFVEAHLAQLLKKFTLELLSSAINFAA
jgi:hypothetical protein